MFLFFQAEDGIRDLVRSRGLGDVYKRQPLNQPENDDYWWAEPDAEIDPMIAVQQRMMIILAVSYTHLTLPTSDLV